MEEVAQARSGVRRASKAEKELASSAQYGARGVEADPVRRSRRGRDMGWAEVAGEVLSRPWRVWTFCQMYWEAIKIFKAVGDNSGFLL